MEDGGCKHHQLVAHVVYRLYHGLRAHIFGSVSHPGFVVRVEFWAARSLDDVFGKRFGFVVRGYSFRALLFAIYGSILERVHLLSDLPGDRTPVATAQANIGGTNAYER